MSNSKPPPPDSRLPEAANANAELAAALSLIHRKLTELSEMSPTDIGARCHAYLELARFEAAAAAARMRDDEDR